MDVVVSNVSKPPFDVLKTNPKSDVHIPNWRGWTLKKPLKSGLKPDVIISQLVMFNRNLWNPNKDVLLGIKVSMIAVIAVVFPLAFHHPRKRLWRRKIHNYTSRKHQPALENPRLLDRKCWDTTWILVYSPCLFTTRSMCVVLLGWKATSPGLKSWVCLIPETLQGTVLRHEKGKSFHIFKLEKGQHGNKTHVRK